MSRLNGLRREDATLESVVSGLPRRLWQRTPPVGLRPVSRDATLVYFSKATVEPANAISIDPTVHNTGKKPCIHALRE